MEILVFLEANFWWILLAISVIFIFCLAWVANFAYDNFKAHLDENLNEPTNFWGTTEEFATYLSQKFFDGRVKTTVTTESQDGFYSPSQQCVSLSPSLCGAASVASVAIVAHEFGHALQAFEEPEKLIRHYRFDRFVRFLGNLNPVLIILGVCLALFVNWVWAVVCLGVIILNFLIAICLKFATITLEKDASNKALILLEKTQIFGSNDVKRVKKFLAKAKRTYTADFLCAVLSWTGLVRKTKFF